MIGLYRAYKKGVRAFLSLVLLFVWGARENGISGDEWWGIAFIVLGALGVIDAANIPMPSVRERVARFRDDRGLIQWGLLATLLLLVLILHWLHLIP